MKEEQNNKIKFKYEFRNYQKRALDEMDKYINDNKIHIVAAPGAGKTILALKLVFDFNYNTLILVPTIAIREQWIESMIKNYLNVDDTKISTDLKNLKKYNVITYQSLYEYNKQQIEGIIKDNHIKVVVLDEAHHLRNAWWSLLSNVFDEMSDLKTISLTATPPYDDEKNFTKYIELCGQIDTQINIPELVLEKSLCPHQDFIYFNIPTEKQEEEIKRYRVNNLKIIEQINNNSQLKKAIATHRFIIDYKNNIDEIISNYEVFIVMVKFLNSNNILIDQYIKKIENTKCQMTLKEYEVLLTYLLYKNDNDLKIISEELKNIKFKLAQLGCIDNGQVNLFYNKEIENVLGQNLGKLNSINEIILHEYKCLGKKMKLAIVTDYIRDDYFDYDTSMINQLGAIPIFKNISEKIGNISTIVLTGSTIIIPTFTLEKFKNLCYKNKIKEENIIINEIGYDFNYCRVEVKKCSRIVGIITELFEKTDVTVLVGTIALIGEGWDAPYVNTLIIASSISSYVTSNQLRGRTIRIDKNNLDKEANIWHLVCLDKIGDKYVKGRDFQKIEKRFFNIDGLSLNEDKIISSINRFNIKKDFFNIDDIEILNNALC